MGQRLDAASPSGPLLDASRLDWPYPGARRGDSQPKIGELDTVMGLGTFSRRSFEMSHSCPGLPTLPPQTTLYLVWVFRRASCPSGNFALAVHLNKYYTK